AVVTRMRGRSRGTRIATEMRTSGVFELRDGLIVHIVGHSDPADALAAVPTRENAEGVRRMWEAFLRRDFDEALAAVGPGGEGDGTNLPDGTISRGHQAIVEHSARWFAMWDDLTIELGELVEVDDKVVVFIRERGRSNTGIDMDERHAEVYTLKDGRIVRRQG